MEKCEKIVKCIACDHDDLELVLDLGSQPLANSYKKKATDEEDSFPLAINRCKKCCHVQLTHRVNPDLLFKDYLYVSGTTQTHLDYFNWFTQFTIEKASSFPHTVLDIGCNDGSQLNAYQKYGFLTFGVDPAVNLHKLSSENHNVKCAYFNDQTYPAGTYFDIITCQNAFAHNYNPIEFLLNAKKVMDGKSMMFITTSQANMILNNEFDTIYHEHISFYNIKSMNELCKRAGLNLVDVVKHPIHGMSYIFIISKHKSCHNHIKNLIDLEELSGLYSDKTYKKYTDNCDDILYQFGAHIDAMRNKGIPVIGYGAAAKGNTLMNAAKVYPDIVIDDNPLKQGLYTPGASIPIFSKDYLEEFEHLNTVCFVPLAWNFFKEIRERIIKVRGKKDDIYLRYFPKVQFEHEALK